MEWKNLAEADNKDIPNKCILKKLNNKLLLQAPTKYIPF